MGLFDSIFGSQKKEVQKITVKDNGTFETLTAYKPVFTTWAGSVYESELIRAAADARARHASKLRVELIGPAQQNLKRRFRKGPNEFQTWGQFLYRLSTILDIENTAFIVPILNEFAEVQGIYCVLPSKCEVREYDGKAYLRYQFKNNKYAAVEWDKCGVMTKFQYKNDFFGTSNSALNPTMQLIDMQNQGITEGVKSSATFRFMAKMTNFASAEDLALEQQRFAENNLKQGAGGVLIFPNTYDNIQQIKSSPYTIDADQMNLIRTNVFNYFGVNEDVLQNKAYGDAWSAFYEGAIEPFAIQLSDVLTNMIYTRQELATGNVVACTANRLQYMSTQEKLNVSSQLADRGILNRDEVREIWNLPPLPDGQGQDYVIRGEYKNAEEITIEETEETEDEENNDEELRAKVVEEALNRMGL